MLVLAPSGVPFLQYFSVSGSAREDRKYPASKAVSGGPGFGDGPRPHRVLDGIMLPGDNLFEDNSRNLG